MECPYCKEEIKEDALICKHCNSKLNIELGYTWWKIYSFLFVGTNLLFFISFWMGFFHVDEVGLSREFFMAVGITTGLLLTLLIYSLSINKTVFLITTIISLNPLIWIINGIYLKNRWQDVEKFHITNEVESKDIQQIVRANKQPRGDLLAILNRYLPNHTLDKSSHLC